MTWAIQTTMLTKRFPQESGWRALFSQRALNAPAVDTVSLEVRQGELFGLLGPNGAGKTTLVKMLSTLIIPTSGSACINGFALDNEAAIKRSIGLASSDERSFYWRLSGYDNLEFFAHLDGIASEGVKTRVELCLQQVGLLEVAHQRFQIYSTGMRQRLSIARALLSQPRLLFLDEPSKGLDPTATYELHELILNLSAQQGITVFLTTHNLLEAELLCDRIAVMHHGRIQACGTVKELRTLLPLRDGYTLHVKDLQSSTQSSLENCLPGITIQRDEAHSLLAGIVEIEIEARPEKSDLNEALEILRIGGATITAIDHHPASLEDIFSHIIKKGVNPQITTSEASISLAPALPQAAASSPPCTPEATARHSSTGIRQPFKIALAYLQRDLRTEASYRFSFFLQFFGIFFSVAVFYFISKMLGPAAMPYLVNYGGDYFSFVIIGLALAEYSGVGVSSFANSLRQAQTAGTLEAMLTTPTSLSTIILSSSLWDYLLTTLRVLVYLLVGLFFMGMRLANANYPAAVLILLLTIIVFSSLGVIAASFIMVLKRGDPVTWAFSAFSSLLGGVYYPITVLPEWMQTIAKLLPITYSLDGMRQALLNGAPVHELGIDILALTLFSLLLFPLSLLAFRLAVRRAKVEGSLTHF